MVKQIRSNLVMGFIVLLPAIATLYILQLGFSFIDRILGNFLTGVLIALGVVHERAATGKVEFLWFVFEERIPGIGFIFMILILIGVGYATRGIIGKRAIRITERAFKRIPVVKSIYSTVQQVTTAFIQDRTSFKKVVLVEYPRKGLYTVGFLTGESQGEVQEKTERECVNVFLPTTPNPTSGWLVIVPKEDIMLLDMSVEQGLKFIISGGVVVPKGYPMETITTKEENFEKILTQIKVDENKASHEVKVNITKKE
ncbi:DUF502 domain-containing protein [Caldalkalibacillus mannanilyticus]|uniref:DUF502 domain-containing protein n=1 Tax=Caldalkalibacillus mannanilyticus TaxID=1418 RepID=UPI0004695C11|nr:DUF502 domain-containing protein [Caldalkalibacillus mannanilyticus]